MLCSLLICEGLGPVADDAVFVKSSRKSQQCMSKLHTRPHKLSRQLLVATLQAHHSLPALSGVNAETAQDAKIRRTAVSQTVADQLTSAFHATCKLPDDRGRHGEQIMCLLHSFMDKAASCRLVMFGAREHSLIIPWHATYVP